MQVRTDSGRVGGIRLMLAVTLLTVWWGGIAFGQYEVTDAYRLTTLDAVEVIVIGVPEMSAVRPNQLQVGPDGEIALPHAGHVRVVGLTSKEAAAEIERRLADGILVDPEVLVRVVDFRGQRVNVIGAVDSPGSLPYRPGMTIRDAIAASGGFVTSEGEATSQSAVRLIGADGDSRVVSLSDEMDGLGSGGGTVLEPGDTLLFEHEATVAVLGYVRSPGTFGLQANTTLAETLARAGGPEEGRADLTGVVLNRADGSVEVRDLTETLEGGSAQDVVVRAGDVVYVPRSFNEASVLGYVVEPGSYDVRDGQRILDLLARAGGPEDGRADMTGVVLNRADGSVKVRDLTEALEGGSGEDVVVRAGDVVYVPRAFREASVLGYVVAPGSYDVRDGQRVLDLVALAGGAQTEPVAGDLANVTVSSQDGTVRSLDLSQALSAPADEELNPPVHPGDIVTVPAVDNRVVVTGFVPEPGSYEFRPGDTVSAAVAMAGGRMEGESAPALVRVRHRDGEEEVVDLGEGAAQLRPGDTIIVPYVRSRVAVLGHVRSPGLYQHHIGDTVVDMLAAAGGAALVRSSDNFHTVRGDRVKVLLFREGDGENEALTLNLNDFYRRGDHSANPEVEPGDVIFVPGDRDLDVESIVRDILILPRAFSSAFED